MERDAGEFGRTRDDQEQLNSCDISDVSAKSCDMSGVSSAKSLDISGDMTANRCDIPDVESPSEDGSLSGFVYPDALMDFLIVRSRRVVSENLDAWLDVVVRTPLYNV